MNYRKDQIALDPDYAEDSMAKGLKAITWCSWIAAGLYYIVMICNFNSLRIAVAVIETTASFVADSKRLILVPLMYFGLSCIFIVMFLSGLVCVSSVGEITVEDEGWETQSKDIVWSSATTYQFWFMCFGGLWVIAFIMAMNEFVTIVAAITWYYSDKTIPDDDGIAGDSDVSVGMKWAVRYHGGTLAFGSFIMALVWVIRIVFEYIAKKMEDAGAGENGFTKCLISCIRCCLACFERFVRYINRNAYIYCALTGESFCSSAINSFVLILKNAAKFGFVEGIASCFMFIAKCFIAIATCLLSALIIQASTAEITSPYGPLGVIFVISYIIATIFIEIFDTGANTILQCYLLDKEVGLPNDEHIPKNLVKFFTDQEIYEANEREKVAEANEPLIDHKANQL